MNVVDMRQVAEETAVLVSVIMPMRNAEPYVRQALALVLQESSIPREVVIGDDGSTDRPRALVASLGDGRIRLLSGPQGVPLGRAFWCDLHQGRRRLAINDSWRALLTQPRSVGA